MNLLPLIESKRDGHVLSAEQIESFARAVAADRCADEQVAALLMAMFLRGLDPEETRALTLAMRDSGEVVRLADDTRPAVDKHSTGGVGDKVSLVLAPLLAALDLRVPMISGRGLGITGGTLDKMESIPGCRVLFSPDQIAAQVEKVGCIICGQTDAVAPADKALYAMRNATGTVPSIPLITASILSKKLAEGISSLLLDVKFGRAAFMPDLDRARELAKAMVGLGNACGVRTRALLTPMNTPTGRSAGNWLEVKEAWECLGGNGPVDLTDLVLESAAHLLELCGRAGDLDTGRRLAHECLAGGEPQRRFEQMVRLQGADLTAFHAKLEHDHHAPEVRELKSKTSGCIVTCDARVIGATVHALGGGRTLKDEPVHPDVGVDRLRKPGETVRKGDVLARVHARSEGDVEIALTSLSKAFVIGDAAPEPGPVVREVVG